MFLTEHTAWGASTKLALLPKRYRRKMIHENMEYMEGMTFTTVNSFPQLQAYTGTTSFESISYTERKRASGHNQAVHFFIDDYRFRDAVWCNLEKTTVSLGKFDYYYSPDFSLWKDLPTEFCNKANIYRTRFVGAFWQLNGFKVIPTASWGGLSSFSYCFEGLPKESVIAVSGMGNKKSKNSFNRWCYGLKRLEESVQPIKILVYGGEVDVPGLHTPLEFVPDFISKHFRHGKQQK